MSLGSVSRLARSSRIAERRPVPDVDDDHREQREIAVAEPVLRRHPEQDQRLVDDAEVVGIHQLPDRADDDPGHEDRQDEDGAVEEPPAGDPRRHQRQREAEHHLERDRDDGEDHRVPDAGTEQRVPGEPRVVAQPHPVPVDAAVDPFDLVEAEGEQVQHRHERQQHEEDQRGRERRVAPQSLGSHVGNSGRARAGHRPGARPSLTAGDRASARRSPPGP